MKPSDRVIVRVYRDEVCRQVETGEPFTAISKAAARVGIEPSELRHRVIATGFPILLRRPSVNRIPPLPPGAE